MTPLQKSIAEIEAWRDQHGPLRYEFKILNDVVSILTANLEYERGEIMKAYKADRSVSNDQADYYYTKTYKHERKD